MKEKYFSSDTIKAKALDMRRRLEEVQGRRSWRLAVESAALLVLDMQDYFLNPMSHAFVANAPAIVPGIQALIRAFRKRGLPVIFSEHRNTSGDAGSMASWWQDLITGQHPFSALVPGLDLSAGTVIHKTQYDAFYNTTLKDLLVERGVRQVVISGVMTHLCCETTARSAFVNGFEVVFLIDGTATYNETFHMASLTNLAHGFATIALVEDLLTVLAL